jgi:SsrA-binding protein
MSKPKVDIGDELVADNRKAGHDFHFLEQFEAGLVLLGTEVKAAREGRVNLRDSYCKLEGGEAYLLNTHIGQYSHGGYASHDPIRRRKLLLNRSELNKLLGKTTEKGLTIVPLRLYFKKGRLKLLIALAKGKKLYDKRETIRRREAERETRAAVKSRRL